MTPRPIAWIKEGDCIISTGHSLGKDGYPQFYRNGVRRLIGRAVLFRRYGEQPTHICMRHTCDNRKCINPDHIIPGTTLDNARDRVERERSNPLRGEQCHWSKLTKDQVREIYRLANEQKLLQREIAAQFGIYQGTVSRIKTLDRWTHIKHE